MHSRKVLSFFFSLTREAKTEKETKQFFFFLFQTQKGNTKVDVIFEKKKHLKKYLLHFLCPYFLKLKFIHFLILVKHLSMNFHFVFPVIIASFCILDK